MSGEKRPEQRILIYDTTLRDGTQSEDISFSVEDKVRIALRLDELGIDYIEGGWPGSNPKDMAFFREIRNYSLKTATVAAFGSTARASTAPENDANLKALLAPRLGRSRSSGSPGTYTFATLCASPWNRTWP